MTGRVRRFRREEHDRTEVERREVVPKWRSAGRINTLRALRVLA